MTIITIKIPKPIPALKISAIAAQLDSVVIIVRNRMIKKLRFFIIEFKF